MEYAKVQATYTFLDYIQGGTEIFCTVAIDFTGNNIYIQYTGNVNRNKKNIFLHFQCEMCECIKYFVTQFIYKIYNLLF